MNTFVLHDASPRGSYVPVLVPEALLGDIYRQLAEAVAAPLPEVGRESSTEVSAEASGGAWAGKADERFRDRSFVDEHLAPRSETVREAAKYLAGRPDTWVTSEDIAKALELEHGWNSLAGAFGAAGRYFANRDIGLPWDWTYIDTPDGRIRLKMDPAIAEVVLATL
jgi:hypothetical protein